ncbi:MAG: type II secretion system protein, partial [Phycisphaerales bacterium]
MTPFVPRIATRAFSMIELLVVITILGLLIGFGVPAISNILQDSEQSLAENQLRNGLLACRDAAIRADKADAAAVFFFRPDGRTVVVACQYVGKIQDVHNDKGTLNGADDGREVRDVFVPLADIAPITLPK